MCITVPLGRPQLQQCNAQPHIRQRNRCSIGYWRLRNPRHVRLRCQRSPPCDMKSTSSGCVSGAGGGPSCGSGPTCGSVLGTGVGPCCGSERAVLCNKAKSRSASENLNSGSFVKHLPNNEAMVYKIATCETMNQKENSILCITISAMRDAKSILVTPAAHVGTRFVIPQAKQVLESRAKI